MEIKTSISEGLARRLAPFEEMKEKILGRRMKDEKKREVLKRLAEMVAEEKIIYEEERLLEERKRKRQAEAEKRLSRI